MNYDMKTKSDLPQSVCNKIETSSEAASHENKPITTSCRGLVVLLPETEEPEPATDSKPSSLLTPRSMAQLENTAPSYREEYDEYGEVVKVGDLHFTEKTLGSGSYAEVVLAKRVCPDPDDEEIPTSRRSSLPYNNRGSFTGTINTTQKYTPNRQNEEVPIKNDYVAVKIYSKSFLKRIRNIKRSKSNRMTIHTALDDVEKEIALMKQMRHPNLVSLLQVIDSVDSDALYVVLEFVPLGEIMTFDPDLIRYRHRHRNSSGLTKDGYFIEDFAALFFVDILHGLGTF